MNRNTVATKLRSGGIFDFDFPFSAAGVEVRIRFQNRFGSLHGLLPIGDEDDERFAEYMIGEFKKIDQDPQPPRAALESE